MNKRSSLVTLLGGIAMLSFQAEAALTLNKNPYNATTNPNGYVSYTPVIGTYLVTFGLSGQLPIYVQVRATGSEVGTLADAYSTTYVPTTGTGTITIDYTSATAGGLHANATYLTVADTLQGAFLFSLAGWDGVSAINIPDLWPFSGAPLPTSNAAAQTVSIYGTAVPEPSTYFAAALLSLPVLAQVRRMRKSA
jgi:hypothetical protein